MRKIKKQIQYLIRWKNMLKNLIKIKKFKTNNNYFKINIKNIIKRNIVNRKIREIENTKQIKN